ncbi:MAG: UDP-N-acetylmuramoyl-L-alanine--D-glutamate ligase [bacterium]|nr:UDP-N-acetylmuramoyl-L-alanine--D-glutamate ligase [bacterium]
MRSVEGGARGASAAFAGREVLVLGVGRSGTAAAVLLLRAGARVRASDSGSGAETARRAAALERMGCRVEIGGHTDRFARGAAAVVASPGVPPSAPVVRAALAAGVPVMSEIELADRFCGGEVAAVTGTNGKTTTVTLLQRMLAAAGLRAVACGNIGRPFSECAADPARHDLFVVEVSSFQLELVREFRPRVAALLNISPDHLDRHGSMEAYAAAKAALFRRQGAGDWAIVRDDEREAWLRRGILHGQALRTFGRSPAAGEGARLENGTLLLETRRGREEICGEDEIRLAGRHNVENVLAAAAAAAALGAGVDAIRGAATAFGGLPHRMEPAGERGGVRFINDSKATNPDAVRRALGAVDGGVILIAGGRDKGFDYSVLRGEVARRARAVVLIGEAAGAIGRALAGAAKIISAPDMDAAVRAATAEAAPGETVLLSPACSSHDMFRDYEERGEAFRRAVGRLMAEAA